MSRHWLFSCPGTKFFTDISRTPQGLELACTSVCHHTGTYDTGGFYSQASLPRVTVNAVAHALALIGRMNFQYLILSGPPNCDRQIVFLLPFLSLYTVLFWVTCMLQTPLQILKAPTSSTWHIHIIFKCHWSDLVGGLFSMHSLRKFIRVESLFKLLQWSWYSRRQGSFGLQIFTNCSHSVTSASLNLPLTAAGHGHLWLN